MKKYILTFIVFFLSITMYCQDQERHRIIDVITDMTILKQSYYDVDNTKGSPYLNQNFIPAVVGDAKINALLRYDVHNDEFEFVNGKDTLLLNKTEQFNTITLPGTNTKYKLVEYDKKGKLAPGYLIWLYEKNNLILFKKQNIVYNKERIAKSSFEKDTPANFERIKDTYYLKDHNKVISEFPSNKKGLLKLYPEKKAELEAFIKQNNIDFEKEPDIIKVVNFLAV